MAIKDYKKKPPATQPPAKKSVSNEIMSKRTMVVFGVGFSLGLLVAGALFTAYLNNYYLTANGDSKHSELATPKPINNKADPDISFSTEASKDQSTDQSIDYQFYEKLEEFELPPASAADTSPQDQPDIPLISNTADEDFPRDGANSKVDREADENDKGDENNENKSTTRYILQAGTFTTALQAQLQRRKIVDLGYKNVHIFQAAYNDGQYHRVWLGPYSELEQAKVIGSALKAAKIEVVLRHNLRSFDRKE